MKNLYKTVITIEDKGQTFERTEEVVSSSISTLRNDILKQLRKYRAAMGMSKNFVVKKYNAQHVGWV